MAQEDRSNGYSVAIAEDGETTPPNAKTDMLVKCLNEGITRVLKKVQEMMAQHGPSCLVDDETDAAPRKIESAEQASRQEWINNHSVTDEDGQAQCLFHFCNKLFKDRAFLHKHLLKEHFDQLRAECAKCHDGLMMAAWERDNRRPVSPVLVDCGSKFGLLQSQVTGSDSPTTTDPELELWWEDRRWLAEEEWRHREREAAAEEEMMRRMEQQAGNAVEVRPSPEPGHREQQPHRGLPRVEAVVGGAAAAGRGGVEAPRARARGGRGARGGGGDDAPEGAAGRQRRGEEEVELRRSGRYGGGEGGAVVRERGGRASAEEEVFALSGSIVNH